MNDKYSVFKKRALTNYDQMFECHFWKIIEMSVPFLEYETACQKIKDDEFQGVRSFIAPLPDHNKFCETAYYTLMVEKELLNLYS